jgi:hypothetical protein
MRRIIPFVLALVLFAPARMSAQDQLTAQKWTDVEWYRIQSWQFTAAGEDTAMTIMWDIYMPMIREVAPESRCFRHVTGEWHITCIFHMSEGPAYYEWETAPGFADFVNGIIERQGEAALDVFETFNDAVARRSHTVLIEPTGGM